MRLLKLSLIAATGALFAGCAGGTSSVTPVSHAPVGAAPAAIASASKLVLTLHDPSKSKHYAIGKRKRDFVSPSTLGLIAEATNPDSTTPQYQGYSLAPSSSATPTTPTVANPDSCTEEDPSSGAYTCTLYFSLQPDADPYSVTLTAYDAAQTGTDGSVAANSNALSIAQNVAFTITAGQANTADFHLQGIVAGFYTATQYVGIPNTAGATATLNFLALDADGNPITDSDGLAYVSTTGTATNPVYVENATFTVTEQELNCSTSPCYSVTSGNTSFTTGASNPLVITYNGDSQAGNPPNGATPGFGEIDVNGPADYVGYNSNGRAAHANIQPFFPLVDQSNPLAAGPSTVEFYPATSPSSITAYGLQANTVTGQTGLGYSVDDSDCSANATYGDIADASSPQANYYSQYGTNIQFGERFTITEGATTAIPSNSEASCTIKLYDELTIGKGDEADITVNSAGAGYSFTVPPGNTGTPNSRKRTH